MIRLLTASIVGVAVLTSCGGEDTPVSAASTKSDLGRDHATAACENASRFLDMSTPPEQIRLLGDRAKTEAALAAQDAAWSTLRSDITTLVDSLTAGDGVSALGAQMALADLCDPLGVDVRGK